MNIVKRRLTSLWRRQTTAPNPPRPWPIQYPDSRMLITIREPLKISGTLLLPGRYALQPLDPEAEHTLVQIFNEDHSRLVATLTAVSHN
jgi:hypothetical protein